MRSSKIIIALVLAVMLGGLPRSAQGQATPTSAQLSAFQRVLAATPDLPGMRDSIVSYADSRAMLEARQGAARVRTLAEWAALDPKSAPGKLFLAALNGIAAGNPNIARSLLQADQMVKTTGLDPFAFERNLYAGTPPQTFTVVEGTFDPAAVSKALTGGGYAATTAGDLTVLCAATSCDDGTKLNISARNPANPFGGVLGRLEPIALNQTTLLNSPDYSVVQAAIALHQSGQGSLLANPDFQAYGDVLTSAGVLVQVNIFPARSLTFDPTLLGALGKVLRDRLFAEWGQYYKPLPSYDSAAYAHVMRATDQAVLIALVYKSEEDAKAAAAVLPARLEHAALLTRGGQKMMEVLAAAGAKLEGVQVQADAAAGRYLAVVTIAMPNDPPEPTGELYKASGLAYKLLYEMVIRRDYIWLLPVVPGP